MLAVLAEKERTTPDDYPLSRNALTRGCNQSTSRFPVVNYSESEVDAVLVGLKEKGLLRFVHASHGRSVTRYRQIANEVWGLDPAQMALVAALALRGPQTVVELRTRTERSHGFASLEEVTATLESLARMDPPFAVHLERMPGQKESRWTHCLAGEPEVTMEAPSRAVAAGNELQELRDRVSELESVVAMLRSELGI